MSVLPTNRREAGKLLVGASVAAAISPAGAARVGRARLTLRRATVEWLHDPCGIDTRRPRFRWILAAAKGARNLRQGGFRIRLFAGAGAGVAPGTVVFDTGFVRSDALAWRPSHDLPLVSQAAYEWRITIHDAGAGSTAETVAGRFTTGLIHPGPWQAAWISAEPDGTAPTQEVADRQRAQGRVMPLFRHDFRVPGNIRAAYLAIAGLGHHACFLNGVEVQPGGLSGGWTDFTRYVIYDNHDVTALLRSGANAIAVMLGNGFFAVENVAGRYAKLWRSNGPLRLIARLRIILADGSEQVVTSGPAWRTRAGPVTFSSIYGGEDCDARRIARDWATGSMGPEWTRAHEIAGPGGALVTNGVPPVSRARRITPTGVQRLANGNLRYDFGVNFAGRPRIVLRRARAGQTITLWPGELLMPDGTVDQRSMTGQRDGRDGIYFRYVARGDAEEIWEPRFTYTGYRYLEVEGAAADQIVSLEGCVLHAGLARTGHFACADPRLVEVHALIEQALVSNLASVVTDCPHREKLGWLEQIYLNATTVTLNRDAVTLYEKMVRDMRGTQQPNGMVPSIAPEYVKFLNGDGSDTAFRDSPEWGTAIVLGPWSVYRTYGDAGILRENWAAMVRYARYLAGRAQEGLIAYGLGDWFDIGPKPSGPAQLTSLAMTGTATLYADLDAMARIAAILGRADAARDFAERAAAVRTTINTKLYDPVQARYDRGSQAANAMALALGIAPPADRPRVLANLIAAIRERDDHVSAGDIGFHYVVRALNAEGRGDVLYDLLKRTDAPSYLAQIASGATALTEAWNGDPANSQNHFMLGHIEQWFYGGLGGLDIDFARRDGPPIMIAPQPVSGLASAKAAFDSAVGTVACDWAVARKRLRVAVEIPAGATARVRLPVTDVEPVREGGVPLSRIVGLRAVDVRGSGLAFDVGSGSYAFETPYDPPAAR
ncbi:MAG TPA: family 78 glycoside hydrolase catalytic domain [Sphingomonas sp.]|jgi:hypothetical protein|uniref:family 78 glycoside hydrolase catalytic domain n=1 Tax=Sphingomonas sp. TaxID=28214 RepID=UPI002ED79EAA